MRTLTQPRDPRGRYALAARSEALITPLRISRLSDHCALDTVATRYLCERYEEIDEAQASALWSRLLAQQDTTGRAWTPETREEWASYCLRRSKKAAARGDGDWAGTYARLAETTPADIDTATAFMAMPVAGHRATEALSAQVAAVAAFNGVSPALARSRIAALRSQYADDLADLPAAERPDSPGDWVTGFTSKDFSARPCPYDSATLYAFYRAQGDEDLFAAERRPSTFASVDLETAGPVGGSGFKAKNGHIIEVGVIVYDDTGAEVSRHEQLIRPPADALDAYGTGAVEIHHITPADLAGAPSWPECAAATRAALGSHVLLAQNARFERAWLGHHLKVVGQDWDSSCAGVDTLRLAQQHYSGLPHHRLANVCEALGVAYTRGHRATHDAEVAGRAFFAMRSAIRARYAADPRFSGLPRPRG